LKIEIKPASPKFKILYEKARYKVLYGGRASAKSWAIAEALIYFAYTYNIRILCCREIQKSIRESSYRLILDTINRLGLSQDFEFTREEIRCKHNGSMFIFMGLKNNPESVKSLENISIVWGEESNTFSQESLDILIPTIRAQGSEIWFSYNPSLPSDPVSRMFQDGQLPPKTLVEYVTFEDNPFLSEAIIEEIKFCKETDAEAYAHIWLGGFKSASNKCLFSLTEIQESIERTPMFLDVPKVASVDVARFGDDLSTLAIKEGNHITKIYEWAKLDNVQLAGRIAEIVMSESIKAINIDNGGNAGGGVIDVLKRQVGEVCRVLEFRGADASTMDIYTNKRTECYYKLQDWMKKGKLVDNKSLIDDLSTVLYDFNSSGQKYLLPKDKQKKLLGRSPDHSDVASMLFDPALRPLANKRERQTRVIGWDG